MSHLHFYFDDIVSGKHPTAIIVAGQKNKFRGTVIIDDPLTECAGPGSRVVGRAHGNKTMVLNSCSSEGKYNCSVVSVVGRNTFLERVRELPIVSGIGVFRFTRGYTLDKTEKYDVGTGDAVVE